MQHASPEQPWTKRSLLPNEYLGQHYRA
jgi:hypothetical protein